MAGKIYLGTGVCFLLNGRQFKITKLVDKDVFEAIDLGFDDVKQQFTRRQIESELENSNLRFAEHGKNTTDGRYNFDSIEDLSEEEKQKIDFRMDVIKPLLKVSAKSLNLFVSARVSMLQVLQEPGSKLKASRASIYRWLKDYKNSNDDARSLASKTYNCGVNETKVSIEVENIIDSIIDKNYYSKERLRQLSIFEIIYNRIDVENTDREEGDKLLYPSNSTIRRRINARDNYETDKARKGSKHAWDKHGYVNKQEKPEYPFQRVEVDHSRLDLFVVDDINRLPIGRPYITTAVDVFDGYPLGIYIGFEPPSYTSVMHVLSHAISPKTYVKEKYPEIENEWIAFGVPELLVVDNGKEFLSKDLKDACKELGIELYHCPVKMPWYKGTVERYFRTINQQMIHQTKGTTFSNILDKGEYDPQNNAVISFSKLWEMVNTWVVDYYTQKFNTGTQAIPARKRERALQIMEQPYPTFLDDWQIRLMKVRMGSIQRNGIRTKNLYYQSPKLTTLFNELDRKGLENSVKFKFDPTDLSSIFVYDEFNKQYFEVLCTNQDYSKGLNEFAHRVILNELKKEEKEVNQSALSKARVRMMKMIDEETNLTLKEKQKNERIKGTGSNKKIAETQKESVENTNDALITNTKQKSDKERVNNKVVSLFDDIDYEDWGTLSADR
jgi:putative transposase